MHYQLLLVNCCYILLAAVLVQQQVNIVDQVGSQILRGQFLLISLLLFQWGTIFLRALSLVSKKHAGHAICRKKGAGHAILPFY